MGTAPVTRDDGLTAVRAPGSSAEGGLLGAGGANEWFPPWASVEAARAYFSPSLPAAGGALRRLG